VTKTNRTPNEPRRTIKTVKDLPEISLMTFPMNDLARNTVVKAGDIRALREFEDLLRDVGRFSHAAAKSIARVDFKVAGAAPSGLEVFDTATRYPLHHLVSNLEGASTL
jgi:hypothetical protein